MAIDMCGALWHSIMSALIMCVCKDCVYVFVLLLCVCTGKAGQRHAKTLGCQGTAGATAPCSRLLQPPPQYIASACCCSKIVPKHPTRYQHSRVASTTSQLLLHESAHVGPDSLGGAWCSTCHAPCISADIMPPCSHPTIVYVTCSCIVASQLCSHLGP